MAESIFHTTLAKTLLPPTVWEPIVKAFEELDEKIRDHNLRVVSIQQTKAATDSNNHEILDGIWENSTNPEVVPFRDEMTELNERHEKLLKKLREFAKAEIPAPLSESDLEKAKKLANEDAKLIDDLKTKADTFAVMADHLISMIPDFKLEGGFISLLPEVKSTKNARGGRSPVAGEVGRKNRTRIDSVEIDGKLVEQVSTKRDKTVVRKSNLIVAADELCRRWNSAKFPANGVTDEELEHAMYDAHNKEFRDAGSLPVDVEFEFTKNIQVQQPNDDSTKTEPHKVKILVHRNVRNKSDDDSTETETQVETPKAETAETENTETEDAKSNTEKTSQVGNKAQEMLARKNAANTKK